MLSRLLKPITSLKLTVTLLALGIVLVFFGTLAQTTDGLWLAQQRYFKSWFCTWSPHTPGWQWLILPLPGGYLLGVALLVNLLAAHAVRFHFTAKKSGILLTHFGVILLLVGQLITDMFAVESQMRLTEGQAKNYSESTLISELAVRDVTDPKQHKVVTFPESMVNHPGELNHPELPFTLKITEYWENSDLKPRGPMSGGTPQASQGIAQRFSFTREKVTRTMDTRNLPAAFVEVQAGGTSKGSWVLTPYASDETVLVALSRSFPREMGGDLGPRMFAALTTPQRFEHAGRTYELHLRPERYYQPHSLELLKFTHEKYIGTDTPKDFRSRVRLECPTLKENRELDIYMNNPLRYAGLTYFQASFDKVDPRVTVLQVVKNPGWMTPYFGCGLVGLGLIIQFLMHLSGFIKKQG